MNLRALLILPIVMTFYTASMPLTAAADQCTATYGTGCPSCAGTRGRSYTNVNGQFCTVCGSFCNINYPIAPAGVPGEEKQATHRDGESAKPTISIVSDGTELFFLTSSKQMLYDVAAYNPNAGALLNILVERSKDPGIAPPIHGDGITDKQVTLASVYDAIRGDNPNHQLRQTSALVGPPGYAARVTWDLVKQPKAGYLDITYRLQNERGEEVSNVNNDIRIRLLRHKRNSSEYWEVTGWSELK